jgi:cytochrome c peroxidase
VALAKIEKSMLDRTMPLFNYYMIHWASFTTEAEREIILNWARNHRLAHYSNGLAADEFLNEAVQPVEDYIPVDQAKVALGDLLYHDTRLSLDNTLSCASCHDLETAGVDNEVFSPGVGGQIGTINSPTVFNSVYNFVQFWDGRAPTLATQAAQPPLNPVEMASISFEQIIDKLKQDKELSRQFHKVYPEGYSEATITDAIAEFEKTLLTPNSRLDRYLKGEASAMSELELKGYALFKDYECATCHVGVYMGGQSYEKMGMARDYFADRNTELSLDDMGRFKETGIERDRHRFKVPGLRNIALTEPYFHDGTRKNLRDATADMALYQLDISLEEEELDAFEAFYETLTGEYQGKLLMNKNLNR